MVRDRRQRWKIKSRSYLGLHQLRNDDQADNPRHFLPFILGGEDQELLAYFPELKTTYLAFKERVETEYALLKQVWHETRGITGQKEFAQAVVPRTRFNGLLFLLRKRVPPEQQTEADLRRQWRQAEGLILDMLKGGKR